MRLTKKVARLTLLVVTGMLPIPQAQFAVAAENDIATVRSLVAKIKLGPAEPRELDKLTLELPRGVLRMNQDERDAFDPETVDEIASLLSHPNVGVRAYAAYALGDIGPRALRSVGALLKALRKAEAERPAGMPFSNTEESSFNAVLQKLGVCVPQQDNPNPRTVCDYLLR